MHTQTFGPTFERIVNLRLKLEDAIEAGEPTGDLRQAIKMLEQQLMDERAAESNASALASIAKAKQAQRRADELASAATKAITTSAEQFSLKD